MINLNNIIQTKKQISAPRIVVYGAPKIGKTTFAAQAHSPLILDLEGGSNNLDVARVSKEHLKSFNDVMDILRALYKENHTYKTIVIDSIDWLERMIFDEVAKEHGGTTIDDFSKPALGYGRGYILAQNRIKQVLSALDMLRAKDNMTVILICHHHVKKFDNPECDFFDHHTLKLHERTKSLVQEWSDCIFFAKQKLYTTTKTEGFSKKTKGHAGERVICTKESGAYVAGNRYNLPEELPLDFKIFWEAFVKSTGYSSENFKKESLPSSKIVQLKAPTTTPSLGVNPAMYNNVKTKFEYLEL